MTLFKIKNNYQKNITKFIEPMVNNSLNHKNDNLSKVKDTNNNLMIGEGVKINGNIKSENLVIIQGLVEGDIECNSITIDNSGKIKGKVNTENMIARGMIEGEVNVKNLLEIKSKGIVSGKIFYGSIQIEDEGKLSGEINFHISEKEQKEFNDMKAL